MLSTSAASRKDRNTAAKISAIIRGLPLEYRADCARRFESELRATNQNFDSSRFLRACGVSD